MLVVGVAVDSADEERKVGALLGFGVDEFNGLIEGFWLGLRLGEAVGCWLGDAVCSTGLVVGSFTGVVDGLIVSGGFVGGSVGFINGLVICFMT